MRLIIEPDYERMSKWAANYVAKCINEARALRHGVEESVNHMWTISCLQQHPHAIIVCDEDATDELKHGTYKYFKDIEKDNLL